MVKERNYGIDLLRLVLMFMVCILHSLGQGGIVFGTAAGTMQYKAFWFIEIFCYCAVDGFALISGYMATDKPTKYEKIVDMWFQAFFYSFVITILLTVFGINKSLDKMAIIKSAFPVLWGSYWYFTAFFALFFAIPIINKFIFSIDEKTARKAIVISFVLFSVLEIISWPFKTADGCSAIWLMVLYVMGAFAKKSKLFETKKSITLIIIWAICIVFTWGCLIFRGSVKFINYVSPTIVLSALIMVVLFSRMKFKGTIISKLSPLAFGIYLLQLNPVIWLDVLRDILAFALEKRTLYGIFYVLAFAALLFVGGLIAEFIRSNLARVMRIPELSKLIVRFFDWVIGKVCILLK